MSRLKWKNVSKDDTIVDVAEILRNGDALQKDKQV